MKLFPLRRPRLGLGLQRLRVEPDVEDVGIAGAAGGAAPSAGSSDLPPPNRLLKRSVIDCDDAGAANRLQPMARTAAAATTLLQRLLGRAASLIKGLSLIRYSHELPGILGN